MLRPGRLGRASEGKNYYEGASAIFSTMLPSRSGQHGRRPVTPIQIATRGSTIRSDRL